MGKLAVLGGLVVLLEHNYFLSNIMKFVGKVQSFLRTKCSTTCFYLFRQLYMYNRLCRIFDALLEYFIENGYDEYANFLDKER